MKVQRPQARYYLHDTKVHDKMLRVTIIARKELTDIHTIGN